MAARLVRQKGVREYISAAKSLCGTFPNAQFLLVGPSDTEGRDAISTEELSSLPENVIWTGFREDVPALLQLCDLIVLPSYYREGIPRILMEAALLGVPIVTTDMPGCRDAIDQGRLGILVPPKSAEGLSQGIRTLLNMCDGERRSLGARCGSFVSQNLSLSRVTDQYRDLYIKLGERSVAVSSKG